MAKKTETVTLQITYDAAKYTYADLDDWDWNTLVDVPGTEVRVVSAAEVTPRPKVLVRLNDVGVAGVLASAPVDVTVQHSAKGFDREQFDFAPEADGDAKVEVLDPEALDAQIREDDEDELECEECGNPMVVLDDGTTRHLIPESHGTDDWDHDMDADHVARAPEDRLP